MIRTLTLADAANMAALHADSFETAWPEADMAEHIGNDIALGFFRGNDLAGFVLLRRSFEQGEILTIAVGENHRRDGLAAQLLDHVEMAAKGEGCHVVFLEVAEDNVAAIALYMKAGYEPFGRRPAYYKRAAGRVAARLFQKKL